MRDLLIFIALSLASYWLYSSGTLEIFVLSLGTFMNLGVLVAGMFYSSAVTSPLAVALFSVYAETMSPLRIAMAGSVGAMFADVIIFLGLNKIMERQITIAGFTFRAPKPRSDAEKLFLTLLGGIMLAIPFPDELALLTLSFARMKLNQFMLLSLAFKFLGIFVLAWALKPL